MTYISDIAREAFGMTKEDAHDRKICIGCKDHPTILSELDRKEYQISGLCPKCFERITHVKKD